MNPYIQQHILVVEDEPVIALDLEFSLTAEGLPVTVATSLERALELVRHEPFSAAVVDHHLGKVVCDPLYEELDARGIPFVVVTGDVASVSTQTSAPVLSKPTVPTAVVAVVLSLIDAQSSTAAIDPTGSWWPRPLKALTLLKARITVDDPGLEAN